MGTPIIQKVEILLEVVGVTGKLTSFSLQVASDAADAMADGEFTADEAAQIGRELGEKLASRHRIDVRGHDIFHGPAGGDLGSFVGRITRQTILALRKG